MSQPLRYRIPWLPPPKEEGASSASASPASTGDAADIETTDFRDLCRGPALADPGYSKRDGVGDLFIYLFIKDIKNNRMRIAQQENSVEKRG